MGKEIFINDSVGTVEFPDTMSDDEIAKTIKTKILGQTDQAGDTPKSESPVTVSEPSILSKNIVPQTRTTLSPAPIKKTDITQASKDAEKNLAQEELRKMQVDPKTAMTLSSVAQARDKYNSDPTEENYKNAFGLYSANKDLVDYYDKTTQVAGNEPFLQFTQAPDQNKSDARKQIEEQIRANESAKQTAEAQSVLQETLSTGKSVKAIQEERGGRIARGTKNFLAGAVGTLQGDVSFLGEVTGMKGLKDASHLLQQQVERMSPEESDFIDQIINAGGSSAAFIVPGLGTEALALRMPRMMAMANTLRIGVPTILEAAAEAGNTADQSRQEGKSEADVKKAMWADFLANVLLLAPTNAYGILAPEKAGQGVVSRTLKDMLMEGSQEGAQQIIQDLSQGKEIDWNSTGTQALVGAIIGGIGGGGVEQVDAQRTMGEDRIKQTIDLAKLTKDLPPAQVDAVSTVLPLSQQETSVGINQTAPPTGFDIRGLNNAKEVLSTPQTKTEAKKTPDQNREEAIQLLEHTLPKEEAIKVVVNLNNQQLDDFLNAKESGYQAVNERIQKLKSVEQRKIDMFAKEQEYKSMADEFGVRYDGLQFYGKDGKSIPLFTDSQTGSTFTVQQNESLPDAILRVRKRFEEAPPKPIVPVEVAKAEPIVPEVLPVIEEQKPIEQLKVEAPKVEKVKPVKAEHKPINLDKKKTKKGGRPLKYAQIDENTSPIIASGVRIQPAFELRDGKVQITEEFRGLEDFLDYSNKPSKEQLMSASKKRVEGNIDKVADEYFSEKGMTGDAETFREALRKEIDTFQKQGGHWSMKDIDELVEQLNGFMDNGDQQGYESKVAGLSPVVRKKVMDKLQEQWKEQRNESEIAKSDAEIEDFGNQINGAAEIEDIERILQEFDNEREALPVELSPEERSAIEEQPSSEEHQSIHESFANKAEVLGSQEEVAKSPEKRNDILNEVNENIAEIDEEISAMKKKKRTFTLAPEAKLSHPFIQELYDHIYSYAKAIENNFTRKQINEAIDFYASQRISGQASGQKQIRQELMKALTGVEDVTRREAGLNDVVPLLQKYFEGVQPDQNIIDKLEAKKKGIEKERAKAIGHDQIFIDTFNGLKDEAERKNLSNPLTAQPIILGPEVGKKEVTMKYTPAEDTYTVTYKQIDNHVTHIKHYNTLQQVLKDYRDEVNKYYEDPNKTRSEAEKQKVIKEAEANLDDIIGEELPPEPSKKPGELDDDVLLQEGTSAFDKWFGDSKVVDKNGNPLKVYHGTPEGDISEFKGSDRGLFFTDNAKVADGYTNQRGIWLSRGKAPAIIPVYLSMRNPFIIDAMGTRSDNLPVPWQEWKPKVFGNLPKNAVNISDVWKYAIEKSYDGIIIRNTVDTATTDERIKSTVYAVKDSTQVKSAIGNKGTYDASNPNILLQEGEAVKPSYDNEIRYQKVKFYFNQMFRELGKNEQQFKERINSKYGNKLDNFVKRFFDENEIQERPTVQYVNAGKLPIPREYVAASQYNNAIDNHQLYAVNMMIHNERQGNKAFLLADGTGFGKTRIELAFADAMFKKTGRPALLVTQNKAIIENSIKREAGAIGVGQVEHQSELFDKKGKRIVSMNKDHIEVVTYDDIKSKKYKVDQQYSAVIFDEAQNLKNADSQRAIMSDNIKADHHVYATATPMDNPHNAEYFLSKITGVPENEIRRSMGYKVIFGTDQWGNTTRKIEYEQGKSYSSVQRSLLAMRDSAIENGAMVRREYPFYGMVQPMYLGLDSFQLAEQEAIDSGYGQHPKARMAAIGELSRWVEPLKVNRVFDAVMQDLKEGKQVIIVAEGISDTEIKKLGTTVQGFITQIGNKLKDAGIPHAKIYGGGSLIGDIDKFQSGELKVAIMTPKSGGAGVNLDDSQGKAPRKMYVVTTNYAGDVFEQILGRVSRRNTKTPADIRLVQFTNATTDRNRQNIIQRKLSTLHSIQSGIDPDKAVMDENEEKINGVIRTSGNDVLMQTGEARTPISMDEAVPKPTTKREQVVQAVYAQLPEQQAKAAMFVLDAGAYSAVQNGKAKSISDYYENTLSQVTRMDYDPNMVFGNMLQQAFDKGLFAVHNTNADMIPMFLAEGGIPAPSIAVLTSPENFREFSTEVQLVFERKTVDPQADSNNRLFSNDIYSPRASEYRGSLSKVVEQVKKEFEARPRGAEFGPESRTSIPLRVFAAQEFTDLQQAKDASGKLIKTGTNDGLARLARQSKTELSFAEAVNDILFKEPIGEVRKQDNEAKEYSIQLVENQAFGIDDIRKTLGITKTDKATNDKLLKIQQAMFELFHNVAPDYFEAKPLRVVGVEEIQGVIVSPRMFEEVKKMVKGSILEGKVYKGDGTHDRLAAIRDLMKRNPQIMFQEDLSKQLEEQYIREQEAKGNLNIREQLKEQKNQKELAIRKADLAQKRQAKENQFNSLVRQEGQFKRDIEFARGKNDQEGVQKGLSALKSVQQQMNRLYKELGKSTDDLFDDSPTLFQIPGSRKTVQGATDFADFAKTGKVALYIFENANFSTVVHEFMHIWRRTGVFNEEQIKTLNEWVGSQDWSNWTRNQEEKLARGFERYLYNGEAPNQGLRRIFQKMKKWMQEIYVMIQKGDPLDVELPVEVKRVFDAIFDENAKSNEIFARVQEHNEAKRQARQRMNALRAQNDVLYRMYGTPEMKPLLDQRKAIVEKMKTADPFEMNDLEEQLIPLTAQIDEMTTQLKQLKSLMRDHHQVDKHGNFMEQFISRFALMTRKLGKAGGELVQMGFAADLVRSKLNDIARPHLHEIAKVYAKYEEKNLKVSFKQRDISRAVIQAIENEKNAKWMPGQEVPRDIVVKNQDGTVNEELTADAKIVYQETKQLLDKFRDILSSLGYKTREAYFAHIMQMDVFDQQLMVDMQNRTQTDENGNVVEVKLDKDINADSNRLKPRQDVEFDMDMNLPRVLSSYVGSVTRKLSYDNFVNYIKKELPKDLSPYLKSSKSTEALLDIARDYARNVMHPASGSGKIYNALNYLRKNQYQAFLAYNVKASIDNRLQVNLARLYVTDEADKLENKLWKNKQYEGVYGNLNLAIERSRNAMQNYMELIPSADDKAGKFRQMFEKNDIFKSAEATNWRRAEVLGIIDSAMKDPRYKSLLELHKGDEVAAINDILDDDVAFDKAVSNASYVSVESQVGITPSVRPVIYDHPLLRVTVLMLRSFKNRQVELMVRSLKTIFDKEGGMRENALRSIFARGITPDAEPAEALQYFADYKKSLRGLISQMKKEGLTSRDGLTLKFMEDYYTHVEKQELELAEIVKQIEPGTMTRRRIGKIWGKYYGLLTVNSFSSKLFWYFVSPFLFGWLLPDDKDKKKKTIEDAFDQAYVKVLFDLSPIPAYGGNPKNLTVTPIAPDISAAESMLRYGKFSGRELAKDVVNYSMNSLVPYLGATNRALDYRLSSRLVDIIKPKKNGADLTPQEKMQNRIERQRKTLEKRTGQ